ncbi:DUF3343 domain-containing protein [Vagococcus coleopterorum]|uniref:DUF3343 domain-containing protein n=1 Tax=Vagococcus coleopterorum TaxID=2714946 RepID=A0A6G8AP05_9ENTE|nr:DUF3343 domain-containing protein [Vagococcus coleopterorum]QIL46699.1 DUF3343 domain-containing protein [Vagococcus coleopterorum]
MEGLVVVESTHKGMTLEETINKKGIKARLIPTPESISSSCGLSLKFNWTDYSQVIESCHGIGISQPLIYYKQKDQHFNWKIEECE